MYDNVLKQLQNAGLLIDHFEYDTPSIVRCRAEGDTGRKVSGFYRIYSVISKNNNQYFIGAFGNFRDPSIPEGGLKIQYESKDLSVDDRNAIKIKMREAQEAANNERVNKNKEAATRANDIWAKLPIDGPSEYLAFKKVAGIGLRYSRGSVVVPVKRVDGALVGLQFIDAQGNKKFLTGTPKAGCFHLLGDLEQATCLIIAEGYATAASIHMAKSHPVAVAFDAGNLPKVAESLRKQNPSLPIIIAADDDPTGLKYAHQAAKKVGGVVCVPDFSRCALTGDKKPTDFNDLHVLQNLDAVALQINSALAAPIDTPAAPPPPSSPNKVKTVKANDTKAQNDDDDDDDRQGYSVRQDGIYWTEGDDQGYKLCAPISVLSLARTDDCRNWGLLTEFTDRDGAVNRWLVPLRLFGSARPSQIVEELLDRGYWVSSVRKSHQRLFDYLQMLAAKSAKRTRLVGRFGWFYGAYVGPLGTIGQPEEPVEYHSGRKLLNRSALGGTLEGWRENVASKCVNNPLMAFAVSIAFSGPLLEWLGYRTTGWHMMGDTSKGKSTIMGVASSVCGPANYYHTWNTTFSALESLAAEYSGGFLALDELGQGDGNSAGLSVYALANEEGKARATDTGSSTRAQHKWKLAWLSNGEISLETCVKRAGKTLDAGTLMRMIHLQAVSHVTRHDRDHKGVFHDLHGLESGAALSKHLKQAVTENYGHPFICFIEKLTALEPASRQKMINYLHTKIADFGRAHLGLAAGETDRAANAFALVGECGELATLYGITGWTQGEARKAASFLFKRWLQERGGEGSSEDRAILEKIILILQTKGENNFTRWEKDEATVDSHQPRVTERWGFRKVETSHKYGEDSYSEEELYILPAAFRTKICEGFGHARACELLQERGALKTTKGKGHMLSTRIPLLGKGTHSVYCIKMSALQNLIGDDGSLMPPLEQAA